MVGVVGVGFGEFVMVGVVVVVVLFLIGDEVVFLEVEFEFSVVRIVGGVLVLGVVVVLEMLMGFVIGFMVEEVFF